MTDTKNSINDRFGTGPLIWVLADDRPGNRSQCLGVAKVLGLPHVVKDIAYGPLVRLPNVLLGASFLALTEVSTTGLVPPWPDLLIGAGRRSAAASRKIKRLSGGRTRLVHVMHPGAGAGDFDLIAVPAHDRKPATTNSVLITAAPHGVTADVLAEAAPKWRAAFDHLPRPYVALMIGGSTRRRNFSPAMAAEVGAMAANVARDLGGSLLVSTSRRTEEAEDIAADTALTAALEDLPHTLYRWGDPVDNPYLGYLALADIVIATGDSVSMCTEACSRPGPVYIYGPEALITPKHRRFHDNLFTGGYARPLTEAALAKGHDWTHNPLNPAEDIVAAIRTLTGW